MNQDHENFLKEQAQNYPKWLEVFTALVDSLYSSRNKTMVQVEADQAAAKVIEKELVSRLELGTKTTNPQKGDEYR
jgi:hypothetical protein